MRLVGADEVEYHVRPTPVRRLAHRVRPRNHLVRTKLRGERAAPFVRVDGDDPRGSELAHELQGDVPHAADADDRSRRPGNEELLDAPYRVVRGQPGIRMRRHGAWLDTRRK